jgi:hypothetical protein
MGFLAYLEETWLATFVRESSSMLGFPTFLFMHTIGLSLIVGVNVVVAVRVLGIASGIPLQPLKKLFPFMWAGFILTVISGVALAMANATAKFVNPILLVKLVLIFIATPIMWQLERKVFSTPDGYKVVESGPGKMMAGALLVLWTLVMVAGRLIAYSGSILPQG